VKKDQVRRFIDYMVKRENIRIAKENGEPWPWTDDVILRTFKFTNVRRANDKTTQHFFKKYKVAMAFGPKLYPDHAILYNCGLYRYFGTTAFANAVGTHKRHDAQKILAAVAAVRESEQNVFTGAYVVTNGGRSEPKEHVVIEYLAGLWKNAHIVLAALKGEESWEAGYDELSRLPGFGGSGFMAKEVLQDYLLCFPKQVTDGDTWTPVGPGARRGLNRIWGRSAKPITQQPEAAYINDVKMLRGLVQSNWMDAHPKSGELTAHDVQFCLCEFDKYERARLGQGRPRAKYTPTVYKEG
jgi:hypothetical protein